MTRRFTLLTVNGHPDDETVSTGATLARYAHEGHRVVCVTATRGELGQIVDPALATPANLRDVGRLRSAELARALAALGPIEQRFLDYRDSGTAGSSSNADRDAFWGADEEEATARLVRIVREVRPDVIVAPNAYGMDGHPDHVRASRIARLAFERAGDPEAFPEQLSDGLLPWSPAKLYEPVLAFGRREKLARARASGGLPETLRLLVRAGLRWRPNRERARQRAAAAQRAPTTLVAVGPYIERRQAALAEYRSQIAPRSELLAISPAELRVLHPTEDFALVAARIPVQLPEDDLFAGLEPQGDRMQAPASLRAAG